MSSLPRAVRAKFHLARQAQIAARRQQLSRVIGVRRLGQRQGGDADLVLQGVVSVQFLMARGGALEPGLQLPPRRECLRGATS